MSATPAPIESRSVAEDEELERDRPWHTIVWNDPVNLMTYVTFVFRSYFGYSQDRARSLMLQVHHEGRSVVSTGSREKMEVDVQAMHSYGLWATMSQEGE